jgi:hypothetical protein
MKAGQFITYKLNICGLKREFQVVQNASINYRNNSVGRHGQK